ncbi:MAG: PspC domain-containing protein [Acidimicrobiales bacterium]
MSTETPTRATIGVPVRPLQRGVDNAILGGVCGGLAIRLGVRERVVRIVFCLLALVSGVGLLLYMMLWLGVRRADESRSIAQRLVGRRHKLVNVVIGAAAIVAIFLVLNRLGMPDLGIYAWPFFLTVIGAIGVWRGASPEEQAHLHELAKSAPVVGVATSRTRWSFWLRLALGVIFIIFGLQILHHLGSPWSHDTTSALFGTLVLIGGALILLAPWWLATLNDLTGERRQRVRMEERADVATHLHDSVLQTLTLIERSAGDEVAVKRLARTQERELREWLFNPEGSSDSGTFLSDLRSLENEIENDYGVRVDLVVVGDCESTDRVTALVAAGREAAINAARWSRSDLVSIYAEVEDTTISLFVRDQGSGFDPEQVVSDRQGIALSIRQRITQRGGEVVLKSTIGEGTEVQLTLPRNA